MASSFEDGMVIMNSPGISISPQGAGLSLIFEFQSLTEVLPEEKNNKETNLTHRACKHPF
jgi:hypothetical protein